MTIFNTHHSTNTSAFHRVLFDKALPLNKESSPMTTRTILVVDDDPDIRELIAQTLDDEGYHVIALSDGEHAVALAQAQPPGLVLLDLMMPKTSGWEVLRILRAHAETASVPVVLVSASRELAVAQSELGANGSLAKPFDLDLLLETVRSFVGSPTANE